jgi:hypothetical protein
MVAGYESGRTKAPSGHRLLPGQWATAAVETAVGMLAMSAH